MLLEIRWTELTHFNNDDEKEKWQEDRTLFSVRILLKPDTAFGWARPLWCASLCDQLEGMRPSGARVGSCPSHYSTPAELINTSELSASCLEMCSPVQSTHVIQGLLEERWLLWDSIYLLILICMCVRLCVQICTIATVFRYCHLYRLFYN